MSDWEDDNSMDDVYNGEDTWLQQEEPESEFWPISVSDTRDQVLTNQSNLLLLLLFVLRLSL